MGWVARAAALVQIPCVIVLVLTSISRSPASLIPSASRALEKVDDLNAFAAALMTAANSTATFTRKGNGGFFHSCLMHVGMQGAGWNQYKINGKSMQQAAVDWWAAASDAPAGEHTYTQGRILSQTVPHQTNPSCLGASDRPETW